MLIIRIQIWRELVEEWRFWIFFCLLLKDVPRCHHVSRWKWVTVVWLLRRKNPTNQWTLNWQHRFSKIALMKDREISAENDSRWMEINFYRSAKIVIVCKQTKPNTTQNINSQLMNTFFMNGKFSSYHHVVQYFFGLRNVSGHIVNGHEKKLIFYRFSLIYWLNNQRNQPLERNGKFFV